MNKEKIKILAIVKSGEQKMYVLNRLPQMSYTKIDSETIIGDDEGVHSFYKRDDTVLPFGKTAFAGRKFTLQLTDGTTEECNGQWRNDMSESARKIFPFGSLCYFACATKNQLRDCYLFTGYCCEKDWFEKLIAEYKGATYEYWEYKKIISSATPNP